MNESNNAKRVVNSMISLFLYILHRANRFGEKTNDQENLCHTLRLTMKDLLKDWVVHKDVIGGSFFGFTVKYDGLRKEEQELKV